jgi:hypothetical protein
MGASMSRAALRLYNPLTAFEALARAAMQRGRAFHLTAGDVTWYPRWWLK